MGEVVEISIVCKKLKVYEQLLFFLTSYVNEDYIIEGIKAMDNWKYENLIVMKSFSDIEKIVQNKIVCIDLKTNNNYLGIFIEKKEGVFYIDGWINPKEEIIGQDYERFLNSFVDAFKHNKLVEICGVGKEIFVDYDLGFTQAIEKGHNIDLWMVSSSKYIISKKIKSKIIYI